MAGERPTTEGSRDASIGDAIGLFVSVAGLTASIAFLFFGMRAVMDVGGACADGGPYVSAQPCPEGVPFVMTFGMLGIFGFGGLGLRYGWRLGGVYASLPFLAWPALFCSLGWNFLEYGIVAPPPGEGIVWGFAIPGVMFLAMGLVPLAVGVAGWRAAMGPASAPAPWRRIRSLDGGVGPLPTVAAAASGVAAPVDAAGPAPAPRPGEDDLDAGPAAALVDRLARLAELRREGSLADEEYETAKDAILRELEELG